MEHARVGRTLLSVAVDFAFVRGIGNSPTQAASSAIKRDKMTPLPLSP
jgi:hypothetical protein